MPQKAYKSGAVFLPTSLVDLKKIEKDLYVADTHNDKSTAKKREVYLYYYTEVGGVEYIAVPRVYGERYLDEFKLIDWSAEGVKGCLSDLSTLVPRKGQQDFVDSVYDLLLSNKDVIASAHTGFGKAQPLSEPILTPAGWKTMGDIKKGSLVYGSEGMPIEVTGVYDQGLKEIYRVGFNDGSSVRCCLDHLWEVHDTIIDATSVITTEDILNKYASLNSDLIHPYTVRLAKCIGGLRPDRRYTANIKDTRHVLHIDGQVEALTLVDETRSEGVWTSLEYNSSLKTYDVCLLPKVSAKRITCVDRLGYTEHCQCISVDSEDSLYVTTDYTLTHNTVVGVEIARKLNTTTLIIADQTKLVMQWADTLTNIFGMDESEIGHYSGYSKEHEGKPVCLATIQTLYRGGDTLDEFYDKWGFTIVDESHSAGSEKYGTVLMNISSKYRLGVSATANRGDALQKVLDYNLGEVAYLSSEVHKESSVRYIEYDKVISSYANEATQAGTYESEIASDGARNLLIAKAVKAMYDKGRDILVIGSRSLQLHGIMALCEYLGVPEEDMGVYSQSLYKVGYFKDKEPPYRLDEWGGDTLYTSIEYTVDKITSKKEREAIKDKAINAKVIFSTYNMFSKGTDVPRLSVGFDVTPRSKAVQTHGRILRDKGEGSAIPVWVTIRDINSVRAEIQFLKRLSEYSKSNANEVKQWDLQKGLRTTDVMDLKREVQRNIRYLEAHKIVKLPDGTHELIPLTTKRK